MARKPRFNLPGVPQHVIQRGSNLEPCFFSEQNYHFYLNALQTVSQKADCVIHACVLITNHVHQLASPGAVASIPAMMQALGGRPLYHPASHHRAASVADICGGYTF